MSAEALRLVERKRCATRGGAARCSTRAVVPVEVRRRDGVGLRAAAI